MAGNKGLINANKAKKDEFYTQLEDIEKEMRNYRKHFKGKVVFCNCDDPEWSNFWRYFVIYFEPLGLKQLIATHYNKDGTSYKLAYSGDKETVNGEVIPKYEKISLKGDGDFRSDECIEILKGCDIVCSNPPFSLFREYVAQLIEYEKDFVILGNMNAITYKEIFPLIKDNKIWLGQSIHSGDRWFRVPDDYPLNASSSRVDDNGNKYIKVKGVRWFTNLDYKERHEDLPLYKNYTPESYPKYDNYDAIEVSKTKEIPCDYDGAFGVPITFLDKYNPSQFEIIKFRKGDDNKDLCINGECPYFRIIIKKKQKELATLEKEMKLAM